MSQSTASTDLAKLARLHAGLLDLASIVATTDQSRLFEAVARTVSEALGWRVVVVNVYRREWDDYEVQTVHGPEACREALLGEAAQWSTWAPLLADRFEHRGAFLVRHGDFDWSSDEATSWAPEPGEGSEPDAWHPDDALFVALHARDGSVNGVLSVDDPASGRLPTDDEIDALVAIAAHAEVALRHALKTGQLRAHRAALEHFHDIFARGAGAVPVAELLEAVKRGVRVILGFERVEIDEFERDGREAPAARLLAEPYEREGCYLMTAAAAAELAPGVDLGPPSDHSGRGPHAWQDHRLLVPVHATTGELLALIRAGDPRNRLLPGADVLRALRVVGDQVAFHLESAARIRELHFLANHDALTGLGNRRAFTTLLESESARAARYGSRFTLALCDVDSFKELNDRYGHPAGDAALRRTAQVMASGLRRTDGAFRIGGDEFALVLVEATADATREIIDRIEGALRSPGSGDGPSIRVSFGAISSDDEADAESMLRRADEAMYAVKRGRRPS